ncbi:hypothetical protein SADUNF_Sadunf14G0055600 [Salix dunnii]|uniref:Uncharacterized protein n=1 Tax=Salix dunnii TaxID=1413687 RepID=A0A835JIE8_9ROSI|nr:hypothetical protein SADUNF_Sadunf14G0055600 [Salix dunnii]
MVPLQHYWPIKTSEIRARLSSLLWSGAMATAQATGKAGGRFIRKISKWNAFWVSSAERSTQNS